jgi:muramoyltetrapeptide carboxypeptidase
MIVIRPAGLRPGATVGIASVSAPEPVTDREWFDRGVESIERRGYRARLAAHARGRHGYLSAPERELAADLHELFADAEVAAIICAGGGTNANRLLRHLDHDLIRSNPKILVGVSNPTVLLNAITARTGLITFHGPAVVWDLGAPDGLSGYTEDGFWPVLTEAREGFSIESGPANWSWPRPGRARGRLVAGNLTSLQTLLGTSFEPAWDGAILAWEDVGKPVNRLDLVLTHFRDAGALSRLSGMVVGELVGCEEPDGGLSVDQMLEEVLDGLGLPVLRGVLFGHTPLKATLPIGAEVSLDSDSNSLTVCEPVVGR